MKTLSSAMEVWHSEPNLRSFFRRENIIREEEDGRLSIPSFPCVVEKPGERGDAKEYKEYPFHNQRFQFILDASKGDYVRVIEGWTKSNSFVCGKNLEITVTLI